MAKQRYTTNEVIRKLRDVIVLTFVWMRCCISVGSLVEHDGLIGKVGFWFQLTQQSDHCRKYKIVR